MSDATSLEITSEVVDGIPGLSEPGSMEALFERHHKIPRTVDAKSSVMIAKLPGGFWDGSTLHRDVTVCELDGEDEDVLVSDTSSYPLRLNKILSRKIQGIGSIVDEVAIKSIVPKLSVLDRAAVLICVRRVTHGDDIHGMEVKCAACKTTYKASPDLSTITFVRPLQPEKVEWEFRLPRASAKAGKDVLVRWHSYDGEREARVAAVSAQVGDKDALTWRIMGRITAIDGTPMGLSDEHFTNDGKIRQDKSLVTLFRAVKLMSQADRNALRNEFVRVEGDIDLTVGAQCSNPSCTDPSQKFTLDITDRSFFFPREGQSG